MNPQCSLLWSFYWLYGDKEYIQVPINDTENDKNVSNKTSKGKEVTNDTVKGKESNVINHDEYMIDKYIMSWVPCNTEESCG